MNLPRPSCAKTVRQKRCYVIPSKARDLKNVAQCQSRRCLTVFDMTYVFGIFNLNNTDNTQEAECDILKSRGFCRMRVCYNAQSHLYPAKYPAWVAVQLYPAETREPVADCWLPCVHACNHEFVAACLPPYCMPRYRKNPINKLTAVTIAIIHNHECCGCSENRAN